MVLFVTVCSVTTVNASASTTRPSAALHKVQRSADRTVAARTANVIGAVSEDGATAATFSGRLDLSTENAELSVSLGDFIPGVMVRLVDDVVYIDLLSFAGGAGGPAGSSSEQPRWLEVDDFQVPVATQTLDALLAAGGPSVAVEVLRAATRARRIGRERVGGENTVHYRGTGDARQTLAGAPETRRAALAPRLARVTGRIAFDVWLDTDGRVRKVAVQLTLDLATGGTGRATAEITLSDFGVPVPVQTPPTPEIINPTPTTTTTVTTPE